MCGGVITAKVLRLDTAQCLKRKSRLIRKLTNEYCPSSDLSAIQQQFLKSSSTSNKPPNVTPVETKPIEVIKSNPILNSKPSVPPKPTKPTTGSQPSVAVAAEAPKLSKPPPTSIAPPRPAVVDATPPPAVTHNFFGDDETPAASASSKPVVARSVSGSSATPSTHNFFGDTETSANSTTGNVKKQPSAATPSSNDDIDEGNAITISSAPLNREQLVAQREQGIQDAVNAALVEKLKVLA